MRMPQWFDFTSTTIKQECPFHINTDSNQRKVANLWKSILVPSTKAHRGKSRYLIPRVTIFGTIVTRQGIHLSRGLVITESLINQNFKLNEWTGTG